MSGPPDLTEAFERSGLIDVSYVVEDSPVGRLLLAATGDGLVCLHYVNRDGDLEQSLEQLAARLSPRVLLAPRRLDTPAPRARRVLQRAAAATSTSRSTTRWSSRASPAGCSSRPRGSRSARR